jgi:hypothetical protein
MVPRLLDLRRITPEEKAMFDESERNAYNAAFYELGFRWHWDSDTYHDLLRRSEQPEERIRFYLHTRQPHLLTAYDADFLVGVIQQKMQCHQCSASPSNWGELVASEIGV